MGRVRILHLSDTHFGKHDQNKCDAVLQFAEDWRPDIIAVTGDILNSPLSRFDPALTFVNALRNICRNVFCIPGNHDAYFGKFALNRFWRRVQPKDTNFVEMKDIAGAPVCIIGVDTTHWSVTSANSRGKFGAPTEKVLEEKLDLLTRQAKFDRNETITIALTHHHPLPTPSSARERMLYFKNAGQFLGFAVRHGVRLILHGHQHDPHFTRIGFGSEHNEIIGVLAAGSCTLLDEGEEFSGCGHFFTAEVDLELAIVNSYYYQKSANRFVASDFLIVDRLASGAPVMITTDQLFVMSSRGDLTVVENRTYERTRSGGTTLLFEIGIEDDPAAACPDPSTPAVAVTIDGAPAGGRLSLFESEPFLKRYRVELDDGPRGERFAIRINYTWPNGFRRLLTSGSDSGEFTVQSKGVEWCRITLDLEAASRRLHSLDVFCQDRSERTDHSEFKKSFTVHRPHPNRIIQWTARAGTPHASR